MAPKVRRINTLLGQSLRRIYGAVIYDGFTLTLYYRTGRIGVPFWKKFIEVGGRYLAPRNV